MSLMVKELFKQLREDLIRDEDKRLKMYKDSEGIWTIGVGRNIQERGIRDDEAELMLKNDMQEAYDETWRAFPHFAGLSVARQLVVLNMVFNMGIPRVRGFKKMWAAIERGNFSEAAVQMLDSKWARQVGARAARLANKMRDGQ
jgi:lysozyme